MHRLTRLAFSSLLLVFGFLPRAVHAQSDNRAWTTYLHSASCGDVVCSGDTVWMATGEAGLLRYVRSTRTWSSITREPSGLAGNTLQCLAFDARGRLFAGASGKGVSWLDTGGRWSLLNEFDGLPSDTALVMRAQGDTVWIGTTRGLALWNGTTLAGSIPDLGTVSPFGNDRINGIAITGDTMFVATPVGVYLARESQRLRPWTLINSGLPLNPNVKSIATDGRVVVALASGKNPSNPAQDLTTSFRWFPQSAVWGSDFPAANSQVRRVRDDYGNIFCTTTGAAGFGGIYRRRADNTGWDLSADSPRTDNLDDLAVEAAMAPDGTLFASELGFLVEEGSPNWSRRDPPGPVGNSCINLFSSRGATYVCYFGDGVSRFLDGQWKNWPGAELHPGSDTTFTTCQFPFGALSDPLGYRWIGSWGGPLTRFNDEVDPPQFLNQRYNSSDPDSVARHSFVWSSAADRNEGANAGRWFGLDSNDRDGKPPLGIDLYDSSGAIVRSFLPSYPNMRNGQIRALAVDKIGTMWVGYAKNPVAGLATFEVPPAIGSDIVLEDVPNTSLLDCFGIQMNGDSVWVLSTDGLRRFDRGGRREITRLDLAGPPAPLGAIHPLAVAPDGSVFVGTTGGVRWHRRGLAPVDFTPDNSPLANIEVRGLFVEPSGVLWVGTASGLNRFDPHYVPPPAPVLPSLSVTVYPNPAWRTNAGFELKLRGQAAHYDGELYDVRGRLVHRFAIDGNDQRVWNGFDLDGRGVPAGVYFLIVRGGGAEAKSRIVVLR